MAYGFPVTAPMVVPSEPYRKTPLPALPDIPEIPAIRSQGLRLQNTIATRLPAIKEVSGSLSMSGNPRQEEVQEYMQAMRVASAERKAYEKRSRAIARAKDRAAQRSAER